MSEFASVIGDVLQEMVQLTREYHLQFGSPKNPSPHTAFGPQGRLSPFDGVHVPSITLDKYLQRLARYTSANPSCFLAALVYLDRLVVSHCDCFAVSDLNIHRLFLACLVVAAKFWSDKFYDNEYYAKIGGIQTHELGELEVNLLLWLDFKLLIESDTFGDEYLKMSAGCTKPLALPTLLGRFSECPCCCLGPHRTLSPIDSILDAMMLEASTLSRMPPFCGASSSSITSTTSSSLAGMIRRAGSPNCICSCRTHFVSASATTNIQPHDTAAATTTTQSPSSSSSSSTSSSPPSSASAPQQPN